MTETLQYPIEPICTEVSKDKIFSWPVRVYSADTDYGAVIHHAAYLRFMEQARIEWTRERELDLTAYIADGIYFVVRGADLQYVQAGGYDDLLQVDTWVARMSRVSLYYQQWIYRQSDHALLCTGKIHVVCVKQMGEKLAPHAIPAEMKASF